jgi:hypothetical protein
MAEKSLAEQLRQESLDRIDARLDELRDAQKEIQELEALRRSLTGATAPTGSTGTRSKVEPTQEQLDAVKRLLPDGKDDDAIKEETGIDGRVLRRLRRVWEEGAAA